ncbi:MAG TPA: BMC domain-containing protein [Candidatus Scatomonas pullistercoris]|uniref:BMC domain-containing protein n=1 Tax=Candidatus Scatomonas pullistercoris TaxID=2840920 RepID=A0A9D1P1D0_9FIRM|nr:BMC domain-containing protein [Candidatus Scatomonas pullistercoris]
MGAIGMNEVMSIPAGMEACDAMLKAAEVELVSAGCVCAGKYYIVVAGDVAAVRSSVEAGRETAESQLIDSMVIPNVDSQVAPAISACTLVDRLQALGIMETYSLCAAVQAADAAAKAAEVDLLEVRLGRGLGGKSFILLTGEVAAVEAAVRAAEALEETKGLMARSVVIASPHPDMLKAIG